MLDVFMSQMLNKNLLINIYITSITEMNSAISLLLFYLQYEGRIEENTQGVEVMRLRAQDLDLQGTDNWVAVYDIVKGNEAGYFSIRTDPVTNEGILMLDKVLQDLCGIKCQNFFGGVVIFAVIMLHTQKQV